MIVCEVSFIAAFVVAATMAEFAHACAMAEIFDFRLCPRSSKEY